MDFGIMDELFIDKMNETRQLRLGDINKNLICELCGGYFIDATTIIECLHSFCRTCIVTYLRTSKTCPVCDTIVHKTRPHQNIRSDKLLQDLVYKLVPGLYKDEMRRRREYYTEHYEDAPKRPGEERGDEMSDRFMYTVEEKISLALHLCPESGRDRSEFRGMMLTKEELKARINQTIKGSVDVRYLQCKAGVTVGHLKKFVRLKYRLLPKYQVDMFCNEEPLRNCLTLCDVAYLFNWRRKSPLKLYFSIYENIIKKVRYGQEMPRLTHSALMDNWEFITKHKEEVKAASITVSDSESASNVDLKSVPIPVTAADQRGSTSPRAISRSYPTAIIVSASIVKASSSSMTKSSAVTHSSLIPKSNCKTVNSGTKPVSSNQPLSGSNYKGLQACTPKRPNQIKVPDKAMEKSSTKKNPKPFGVTGMISKSDQTKLVSVKDVKKNMSPASSQRPATVFINSKSPLVTPPTTVPETHLPQQSQQNVHPPVSQQFTKISTESKILQIKTVGPKMSTTTAATSQHSIPTSQILTHQQSNMTSSSEKGATNQVSAQPQKVKASASRKRPANTPIPIAPAPSKMANLANQPTLGPTCNLGFPSVSSTIISNPVQHHLPQVVRTVPSAGGAAAMPKKAPHDRQANAQATAVVQAVPNVVLKTVTSTTGVPLVSVAGTAAMFNSSKSMVASGSKKSVYQPYGMPYARAIATGAVGDNSMVISSNVSCHQMPPQIVSVTSPALSPQGQLIASYMPLNSSVQHPFSVSAIIASSSSSSTPSFTTVTQTVPTTSTPSPTPAASASPTPAAVPVQQSQTQGSDTSDNKAIHRDTNRNINHHRVALKADVCNSNLTQSPAGNQSNGQVNGFKNQHNPATPVSMKSTQEKIELSSPLSPESSFSSTMSSPDLNITKTPSPNGLSPQNRKISKQKKIADIANSLHKRVSESMQNSQNTTISQAPSRPESPGMKTLILPLPKSLQAKIGLAAQNNLEAGHSTCLDQTSKNENKDPSEMSVGSGRGEEPLNLVKRDQDTRLSAQLIVLPGAVK